MACNLVVVIWSVGQEIRFTLGGWLESFTAGRWLPSCGIQIHFQSAGCSSAHESIRAMEFQMQLIRRYPLVEEVSESDQERGSANKQGGLSGRCVSYRPPCWEGRRARCSSLNYQLIKIEQRRSQSRV
ncbi:hypothetical protein VPH35_073301 [Triticum aestivum]